MASFQATTFIPPLMMGPSGGGASALLGNIGVPGASGTTGASNTVGYNPMLNAAYDDPTLNGPFWPINPSTNLPPTETGPTS
jgi:hypothetical protein